jgi:signal transduction histidine kinase
MRDELDKGNLAEAKSLATDVIDNQEKINQHGRRADAIVKGMLQHSQSGKGIIEPANFNALADEYLRLAYHGFKAKDNSFNATIVTDFDPAVGMVNLIPQDIGRVLLNLYNNAFYAVSAKASSFAKASEDKSVTADKAYKPTVTVTSKLADDHGAVTSPQSAIRNPQSVIVTIRDNGSGIPDKIKAKIFQPFFTTKPTGQGTGLGLSLSYDIIKAHQGEIKVESMEGEYTEFIIQLPI